MLARSAWLLQVSHEQFARFSLTNFHHHLEDSLCPELALSLFFSRPPCQTAGSSFCDFQPGSNFLPTAARPPGQFSKEGNVTLAMKSADTSISAKPSFLLPKLGLQYLAC